MDWLTSLPAAVLVANCLAGSLLIAVAARWAVRMLVPAAEHDELQRVAAPLMPALGAAFGVLIAITLASEAGYLKSAQDIVAKEAAAASRLAWAATSPGVRTEPIHRALQRYLDATRDDEWRDNAAEQGAPDVVAAIGDLEVVVRAEAARQELGTPASTELLSALDAVTSGRRERMAAAAREIPVLYLVTILSAGVALVANAGALGGRSSVRTASVIVGLTLVVGLCTALLFSLGAPWRGPLVVSSRPIDDVVGDLRSGLFG